MQAKKILAFAIGPIGGAVVSLLTVPVVTWLFSQEDVGRLAMLQVALGFSALVFSLGLDQAYVRDFHEESDRSELLKRSMFPGAALLTVIILGAFVFDKEVLARLLFGIDSGVMSVLIIVALFASYISRFLSLILRMNERGLAYSMSQLLPKILLLVVIAAYVVLKIPSSFMSLLIANVLAIGFVCLLYLWNTRGDWRSAIFSDIEWEKLHKMLKFGVPLIFGGVAFWALTAISKVFLRMTADFSELALYSVSVSFAGAALIIQSVFSTVWAPTVYKWASLGGGLDKIHKVRRYVLLVVVLGFSLSGLLSWLIPLFLPEQYEPVKWLMVSCMGYPLLYTLSETTVVGIGIARRSLYSMLASMLAFLASLLCNWLFVPAYGAAGAAVSTSLAFVVFFILRTEFAILVWKPVPRVVLYVYVVLSAVGAAIFTLWGERFGGLMMVFWAGMLASCLFFFKRELGDVFKYAGSLYDKRA